MRTMWCQWSDLNLPQGFRTISRPIETLTEEELTGIEIYVPLYMGGSKVLSPISKMKNLKVLQLLMAGYEDALPYKRDGLRLFNARGVHDFSTAELTLALILASLRGVDRFIRSQDKSMWNHERLDSIYGKKVAIVGAGSVANQIHAFLKPFEVETTFFGRSERDGILAISSLDQQVSKFDIVILIVPLTDQTRGLFDKEKISRMKKGSLLVNVARGPVVDSMALVDALHSGHIRAVVDVTDPEPLPSDHPLWRAPNLIISPHVGGDSAAFEPHGRRLIEAQIRRIAQDEPLLNEISW